MSRHLLRFLFAAAPEGVPDADLLRRFTATRDESAFELLVRRHADLVWNVCCGVLRHDADAEDAFQATFLALARRADAIRTPCAAGWLQRVAVHAALKQKAKSARFRHAEVPEQIEAVAAHDSELAAVVHEELAKLPEAFRLPVLLCDLEGHTHAEAAKQLGWPIGTVSGRLSRARDRLRERLTRRGVAPVILGSLAASSGTIRAAVAVGVGAIPAPAGVLALTTEVLSTMQTAKRNLIGVVIALMIGVAGGGTLVAVGQADAPAPIANAALPVQVKPAAPEQPQDIAGPKERALSQREQAKPAAPEKPIAGPLERALSQRNLRAVAQAVLAYTMDKGHLPTDILDAKTKKPLLSWRVAILPYMEQRAVHKLIKLDEPWDSENNKRLGQAKFKVYAAGITEEGVGQLGMTLFKRFSGAHTLHQPGTDVDVMKTPDGRPMTLLLAEVGDPVPWIKPDDPVLEPADANNPFAPKTPAPWTGPYSNVINVAFADGLAFSLKPDLPRAQINSLIYSNDAMVLPERGELVAAPSEAQDAEDFTALLKAAREMADQLIKLTEEEANLRAELAALRRLPLDQSTPLADRLIELDAHLRQLRGVVEQLRKEVQKAKTK